MFGSLGAIVAGGSAYSPDLLAFDRYRDQLDEWAALGVSDKPISFRGFTDNTYADPATIITADFLAYLAATGGSFTRASAKTMLDSADVLQTFASGVPAITDRGISVEDARTNIAIQCDNFSDASWAKLNVTVATDAVASPNPSYMADTITSGNVTSQGFYQTISGITPNSSYTLSFFAKLGTMAAADFKFAVYDASNGAFIASNISPTVTLTGDGWSRVSYTFTAPAGCTGVRIYPFRANAAVVGTVSIWFVQLEAGAFASSPIYTTSSQATRAADIITRTRTSPTVLSKVIRGRTAPGVSSAPQTIWQIDDGGASNRILIRRESDRVLRWYVVVGGVSVVKLGLGTVADDTDFALALRATTNDFVASLNGGAVVTKTSAAMPTGMVNERLGGEASINQWFGTISLDAEWSSLLSNTQLQALSA